MEIFWEKQKMQPSVEANDDEAKSSVVTVEQVQQHLAAKTFVQKSRSQTHMKPFASRFMIWLVILPFLSLMGGFSAVKAYKAIVEKSYDMGKYWSIDKNALKCHRNAYARYNSYIKRYQCACLPFYAGNGRDYCEPCGTRHNEADMLRIVGGNQAKPHSWPMAVHVEQEYHGSYLLDGKIFLVNEAWQCGGILINPKTVLTAAHCVHEYFWLNKNGVKNKVPFIWNSNYPNIESTVSVFVGAHDLRSNPRLRKINVKKVKTHPEFYRKKIENDIALIILDENVLQTKYTDFACLPPENNQIYPGDRKNACVIGWGKQDTTPILRPADVLHYAVVDILTCDVYSQPIDKTIKFCAGKKGGGPDSCNGDSGNGLYVYEINQYTKGITDKRLTVAGIVSHGIKCGSESSPGVYTRVSTFLDWIYTYSEY